MNTYYYTLKAEYYFTTLSFDGYLLPQSILVCSRNIITALPVNLTHVTNYSDQPSDFSVLYPCDLSFSPSSPNAYMQSCALHE